MVARKKIVQQLATQGQLIKTEAHTHNVGFSERTNAVVEPRLSTQWFVKMKALAAPALAHVLDGTNRFHPAKLQNMYKAWLEDVQDWCISRQLWWGHRIPAYYLPDGAVVVAKSKAAALEKAQARPGNATLTEADLRQDQDVLDTWFSAWLWPQSVFDGLRHPENTTFRYFYPTNDLVTAPEIIFFWVARMVMAGYAFQEAPPFRNVYFTGIVRDKQGRKMSKSLGNSPDPLALTAQYSADGVRVGMLLSAPAGNDLLFDEKLCEQGRNFARKIWNAFRLVQDWKTTAELPEAIQTTAMQWFQARCQQVLQEVEHHFQQFRIADALKALYKLVWNDFCAWYLEIIKPAPGQPLAASVRTATIGFFEVLLKLLHPFMPFLTEELWHQLASRAPEDCLIVAPWPKATAYDPALLQDATAAFALITTLRSLRNQAQVSAKEPLPLSVAALPTWRVPWQAAVQKLAYLDTITLSPPAPPTATSCTVQGTTICLALDGQVDAAQERARLEKELAYAQGFLASVLKKLDNERFVQSAPPQVVTTARKKQADAEAKIASLQTRLQGMDSLSNP